MIARTLRGLGALALIALALIGWPAALLGLTDAVAVWLPDLSDPAALLSRPDTGGLFLVIVLALGWVAWVVWTVALIVEVAAQVRGGPPPTSVGCSRRTPPPPWSPPSRSRSPSPPLPPRSPAPPGRVRPQHRRA
jgi:hypothetical protein